METFEDICSTIYPRLSGLTEVDQSSSVEATISVILDNAKEAPPHKAIGGSWGTVPTSIPACQANN